MKIIWLDQIKYNRFSPGTSPQKIRNRHWKLKIKNRKFHNMSSWYCLIGLLPVRSTKNYLPEYYFSTTVVFPKILIKILIGFNISKTIKKCYIFTQQNWAPTIFFHVMLENNAKIKNFNTSILFKNLSRNVLVAILIVINLF